MILGNQRRYLVTSPTFSRIRGKAFQFEEHNNRSRTKMFTICGPQGLCCTKGLRSERRSFCGRNQWNPPQVGVTRMQLLMAIERMTKT